MRHQRSSVRPDTAPGPRHARLGRAAAVALTCYLLSGCWAMLTREERQEMSDEDKLELYLTTAQYLYEDNSLDRAESQALKGLEIEDDNVPLRRMLGWIRLRRGSNVDNDIAHGIFRELAGEGDDSTTTYVGLATALERLGVGFNEAADEMAAGDGSTRPALDVEEDVAELRARARELWSEAVTLYEHTLREGEGSTSSINGLQRVNALLGDYSGSLAWCELLLQRSREELAAWQEMLTSEELTQTEERLFLANERYARQLQHDTHLFGATLLHQLERYDEALAHLDEVAALTPNVPQIYSLRAQLHSKLDDPARAIEDVDRFLRLSELPYESAEVQRAFDLRTECELKAKRGR